MKNYIKINIAPPKKVIEWTERALPNGKLIGEITKSDTLNYESFSPITDGLFCEKIFGPINDWKCSCKKYKKNQKKIYKKGEISICIKCMVEITETKIRNYRMGYIKLNCHITHPWYLNRSPSYISIILNKSISETLKISLNKAYIFKKAKNKLIKTGSEAIYYLLKKMNLKESIKKINKKLILLKENTLFNNNVDKKFEAYSKKLKINNYFLETKTLPEWMTIKILPVLPPNIRPIIKLEDKRVITTDLNQLYSKIININNKITKLKKMLIQEKYLNNEKSILQDNVNELILQNKKIKTNKTLKSLTKRIEGKKGRFRENLLGKTVDYSGRSVITIEPKLKLKQCTIPEEIAFELFQPQIIKHLIRIKIAKTVRDAKKAIKLKKALVLQILKNILEKNLVLLNRAPTLHKLGIQAFQAKLNKEQVIQLHPLVCSAFNADFDGDQMGLHLPISLKSQAEARVLMISTNNCASPATGNSNLLLSQDMVLGCYFLTSENNFLKNLVKKIKIYNNTEKILKDYYKEKITLHDYLWIIQKDKESFLKKQSIKIIKTTRSVKKTKFIRTTTGRIIFNKAIKLFL